MRSCGVQGKRFGPGTVESLHRVHRATIRPWLLSRVAPDARRAPRQESSADAEHELLKYWPASVTDEDPIYRLPELRYDYSALEPHISGRIMELHHSKHHAAFAAGANTAIERLQDARRQSAFTLLAMLEKNLAFNLSGHVLHSLWWECLSPGGGGEPTEWLAEQIDANFGGFAPFKEHMIEAAATIQGSGWALASWEPTARRVVIEQAYDHQGNHGQGTIPILAIDAWEHAYYLQYETDKRSFFEAVWELVDWPRATTRFEASSL